MDQLLDRIAQLARLLEASEQRTYRDITRLRDELELLRLDITCLKNNSHPAQEVSHTQMQERPRRTYYAR